MSVFDFNSIYLKFLPKWKKCRDIVQGEDSVKTAGEVYIPRSSGMDDKDYHDYLMRAQFFNATGRTLDGLSGMLNRKPLIVNVPDGMKKYLENVDGKGHSLNQFGASCSRDAIMTNWGGILVDMPYLKDVRSQRDFEDSEQYAYMVFYRAESITKWQWQTNGRKQRLKYVIFKELMEVETAPYTTELKEYRRVCEIDETGYYRQTLYDSNENIIKQVYPSSKKGKFREIPFYFLSSSDMPSESMLEDVANVNLSHLRKSADYENGLHWSGVPTPWSQGADPQVEMINGEEVAKPLKLGGSIVVNLPAGASMHYLEYGGSGCSSIAAAMSSDEDRMAILGARIISHEKRGVEAAETARLHHASENSVLAEFAINLSIIFSKLVRIYLEWSSGKDIAEEDVKVSFNTDYDVSMMSAQQITALVALWQSGGIAKRDLFDNLKDGEILSAERDFNEMNAEIDEEQKAKNAQYDVIPDSIAEQS